MSNQVKIRKGQNGKVIVSHLTMIAAYSIGERMDGTVGLVCDGDLIRADGLKEAITATMSDGVDRAIDIPTQHMTEAEHKAFDASRKAINNAMTLNGKTY